MPSIAGSRRSCPPIPCLHRPGGSHTATPATLAVVKVCSSSIHTRRRNSSNARRRIADRRASARRTQLNTGSSWKARASTPAIAGVCATLALRTLAASLLAEAMSSTGRPQASRSIAGSACEMERVNAARTIGATPGIGEAMRMS